VVDGVEHQALLHRLEDLVVVVEPLVIQVVLEYRDKEILAAREVQHQ
jgi:hypothetical protein